MRARSRRVPARPLNVLWAPWRFGYVTQPKVRGCVFCLKGPARKDAAALVLLRSSEAFVILNKFPYANGHLMVAPYRHVARFEQLTPAEAQDVVGLLGRCERLLEGTLRPDGFNVGANLGRVAGAGVLGHLHVHMVPRWHGDTNFMPLLAGTKVIPQSLEAVYRQLARAVGGQRQGPAAGRSRRRNGC